MNTSYLRAGEHEMQTVPNFKPRRSGFQVDGVTLDRFRGYKNAAARAGLRSERRFDSGHWDTDTVLWTAAERGGGNGGTLLLSIVVNLFILGARKCRLIGRRGQSLTIRKERVTTVPAAQAFPRTVVCCIIKIQVFRVSLNKTVDTPLPLRMRGTRPQMGGYLNEAAVHLMGKIKLQVAAGLADTGPLTYRFCMILANMSWKTRWHFQNQNW